jgi:hypothetical protein
VQVYLLGDFAIKLCVEEGGPWVAMDGLRSEVLCLSFSRSLKLAFLQDFVAAARPLF